MSEASYVERSRGLDRDMLIHRVPDQLRRLLVAIRLLSWDKDRDAAPVDDQLVLAAAAQMNAADCSRTIAEARKMKVLRVLRLGGRWWFEILPDTAVWVERSTTKIDGERTTEKKSRRAPSTEEIERSTAAWRILEAEGDPAQCTLPIGDKPTHPPLGDGGFGDAIAETSRDQADAKLRPAPAGPAASPAADNRDDWEIPNSPGQGLGGMLLGLGNSQFKGQDPNPPELGNSQFTHARTRAPDHDHDHIEPTALMSHDHDSAGAVGTGTLARPVWTRRDDLPPLQGGVFDDIERALDVAGEVMTRSYEELWCRRLSLKPQVVREALADAQRMQKEQRIKKTVGGTLNAIFLDYSGERKPAYKHKESPRRSQI